MGGLKNENDGICHHFARRTGDGNCCFSNQCGDEVTFVDWHPFPDDVPKKERTYLLTIEVPCFPDLKDHCLFYRELRIGFWACGRFFANLEDGERVTAWAFPPKPYKSEAEDED